MVRKELAIEEHLVATKGMHQVSIELRDAFKEHVGNQSYSLRHRKGPLEVSLNTDALGSYATAFSEEMERVGDGLYDLLGEAETISRAATASAETLQGIKRDTSTLPLISHYLERSLAVQERIQGFTAANAVVSSLGVVLHHQMQGSLQRMEGTMEDTLSTLDDLTAEVAEGFDDLATGQAEIEEAVYTVGDKVDALTVAVIQGVATLAEGQHALYLQQQRHTATLQKTLSTIAAAIGKLDEAQGRQHRELVETLGKAHELRAREKYAFAFDQYELGNYRLALQELRAGLRERSTHVPSLLLFGAIAESHLQWGIAKDSYHHAVQHAALQGDKNAYMAAVLSLTHAEVKVGNVDTARGLLQHAKTEYKTLRKARSNPRLPLLDQELFRLDITYDGNLVNQAERAIKLARRDGNFWNVLVTDDTYAVLRKESPEINFGPYRDLRKRAMHYSTAEAPCPALEGRLGPWDVFRLASREVVAALDRAVQEDYAHYRCDSKFRRQLSWLDHSFRLIEKKIKGYNNNPTAEANIATRDFLQSKQKERIGPALGSLVTLAPSLPLSKWNEWYEINDKKKR